MHGDLRKIHAHAYLIPGDSRFRAGRKWRGLLADSDPSFAGCDRGPARATRFRVVGDNLLILADIGTADDIAAESAWSHVRSGVLDAFAVATAHLAESGSRTGLRRERPLFAMPLVGTANGGFRHRRGALVERLVGLLEETVPGLAFDVAVVCFERASYSAVQQARTATVDLPPQLQASVGEVAGYAQDGGLALLFGAGASMPLGLPSWTDLLETFEQRVGVTGLSGLDALDAAAVVVDRLTPDGFRDVLREELPADKHSLMHGLMASLRPRVAITTNYDQCFELAMEQVLGDGRVAVMPWERPRHPDDARLLKLHGDVDKGSIVLSRRQFVEMHAQRRPLTALLQDHFLAGHVLAVGTSLADPTMAHAAEEVDSLLRTVRAGRASDKVGTWLQTEDHGARRMLWEPLFTVLSGDESWSGEDVRRLTSGARMVDVFLDAVAQSASDELSYVADPSFEDLVARQGWQGIAGRALDLRRALDEVSGRGLGSGQRETFRRMDAALADLGALRTEGAGCPVSQG